jgi:hypothetical protein
MKKLRWHDLLACSMLLVAACAQSSVGDVDRLGLEEDSDLDEDSDQVGDIDDRDTGLTTAPPAGDPQDDEPISRPAPLDAGALRDAGSARDAGAVASGDAIDSGAPKLDSGSTAKPDTGTPPVSKPPVDSGAIMSVADAGTRPPPAETPSNKCVKHTDCKNICIAIGIVSCCRDDGRCGCSWAPGAYCL